MTLLRTVLLLTCLLTIAGAGVCSLVLGESTPIKMVGGALLVCAATIATLAHLVRIDEKQARRSIDDTMLRLRKLGIIGNAPISVHQALAVCLTNIEAHYERLTRLNAGLKRMQDKLRQRAAQRRRQPEPTVRGAGLAPTELNFLLLLQGNKQGEQWLFIFDDDHRHHTLRQLGSYAAAPDLSFSWHNAATLSKHVRAALEGPLATSVGAECATHSSSQLATDDELDALLQRLGGGLRLTILTEELRVTVDGKENGLVHEPGDMTPLLHLVRGHAEEVRVPIA